MDPTFVPIALEIIRGVRAGLAWIVARRGGDRAEAMRIVDQWNQARDKDIFGEDISAALAMTASGINFLSERGMVVDEALAVIEGAAAEGRDLTDEEVESFFAATDEVADRVDDAIAELEAEEAGNAPAGDTVATGETQNADLGAATNEAGENAGESASTGDDSGAGGDPAADPGDDNPATPV